MRSTMFRAWRSPERGVWKRCFPLGSPLNLAGIVGNPGILVVYTTVHMHFIYSLLLAFSCVLSTRLEPISFPIHFQETRHEA